MAKKVSEVVPEPTEVENLAPWDEPTEPVVDEEPIKSLDTDVEKPSWFSTGAQGFAKKQTSDVMHKVKKEKSAFRFYLKPEEEAKLIFVDSLGFYLNEHHLKIAGRWGNYITCVKDFDNCEVCNSINKSSSLIAYYTVIDTRKFTKHDGSTGQFTKCLLGVKNKMINKIETLKKRNGGNLTGLVFNVKRYDEKDFSTGSDYEKISDTRIDIATKFGADMATPFDYKKLLAPPTMEELAAYGFATVSLTTKDNGQDESDIFAG